jgi:hypothetical protein
MMGAIRGLALLICVGALAACSSGGTVVRPSESGGNRADGIVALSAITLIHQPTLPDWSVADVGAAKRCRSWGYRGNASFSGWRDYCQGWDAYGRCVQTRTTRYYQCSGG